ncbi:DUF2480 family protein [Sphingobacterium sp.]|uniref:DUF2480 family protein n=1 Tax=Sphingobacterium sp. TaxID=341027 RepID=UPI002FDD7A6F
MFVNKVENTGILALDLIDFKTNLTVESFDIKVLLYQEAIVREKEFREALAAIDWSVFANKAVGISCSVDAIIPPWVYMTLAEKLHPIAAYYDFKDVEELAIDLWSQTLRSTDLSHFQSQKVVIRARPDIPASLYMLATERLVPIVQTLMYGEVGMPKVIFKKSKV